MNEKPLFSLFSENKEKLEGKLQGLSLPKDVKAVESIVEDFFTDIFNENGEYRQHLTQSEDYILQAAINIINAQCSMTVELTSKIADAEISPMSKPHEFKSTENNKLDSCIKKSQFPIAIGGAGIGSATGALLFGSWGAVIGAIAGSAVTLYYNKQIQSIICKKQEHSNGEETSFPENTDKVDIYEQPINVETFTSVMSNICQSIDALIATFRSQVNRIVNKYESIEKPTLESDYQELVENVQSLMGAYLMSSETELRSKRIDQRILLLSECFENYNMFFVSYDGNNKDMFNLQQSDTVQEDTMVLPAVVKDSRVIIKGKVFTK